MFLHNGTTMTLYKIQEYSYLQNYSSVEEIFIGSNIMAFEYEEKNQIFGMFNRTAYDNMETTFYDKDFNALTIESSTSLEFRRYHFYGFSKLEDHLLLTHQLFSNQPD